MDLFLLVDTLYPLYQSITFQGHASTFQSLSLEDSSRVNLGNVYFYVLACFRSKMSSRYIYTFMYDMNFLFLRLSFHHIYIPHFLCYPKVTHKSLNSH